MVFFDLVALVSYRKVLQVVLLSSINEEDGESERKRKANCNNSRQVLVIIKIETANDFAESCSM